MWIKVWFTDGTINWYPCDAIMVVDQTEDGIKIYFKDNGMTSKPIKEIRQVGMIEAY